MDEAAKSLQTDTTAHYLTVKEETKGKKNPTLLMKYGE
jgi:hypothetical protein